MYKLIQKFDIDNNIKVSELIEVLQKLPQNSIVTIDGIGRSVKIAEIGYTDHINAAVIEIRQ